METNEKIAQKQLRQMRMLTIMMAILLALFLTAGFLLAKEFRSIQNCISLIEQDVQTVDMNSLNSAVDAFTDAANQFNKIDMDEFNGTVASLDSAAAQLKGVDVESLNSLVDALEGVATKLQNAVNAISGLFGR